MLKGVAGALGMSYNKVSSDFESTSYSSLRQSNIEDAVTVKEMQQFLIDNWKNVQYAEWLKYLLLSDLTNLPYSKMDKFLSH
jgi:capsid protein